MSRQSSQNISIFESDAVKEAERLLEWARSYERKGLILAADALRDEASKTLKTAGR